MASAETQVLPGRALRDWGLRGWGLALLLALAFKEYYSQVDTLHLQWLLHPLAMLLNATSLFGFEPTGSGEWQDPHHGLVIVKACAGGNFLVASWLGWLWRWQTKRFGAGVLLRAFGAAWLTTLIANALRIALIAYGEDGLSGISGLSAADSHRLIGIVVYFGSLALQLSGTRALLAAPVIYMAVTILLPVSNALLTGRGGIHGAHLAWAATLPMAGLIGFGLWQRVSRIVHSRRERRARTGSRLA